MADTEILAMLNAGRDTWNHFQERRGALNIGENQGIPKLDLRLAKLEKRDFSGWIFAQVDLSGATLIGSSLKGALLSEVDLTQAELGGVDFSNARLDIVDFTEAQISGADLERTSSIWVSFKNATLTGANLSRCRLSHGHFESADLSESSLVEAWLEGANFSEASLRDADLQGANLSGANLRGTDLRGAEFASTNLEGAIIYRTIPSDPDLSGAVNIPSSAPKRYSAFGAAPGRGSGPLYYDPPEEESTAVRIRVFYVTDRVAGTGRRTYGTRQSEKLSLGTSDVSIPKFHRPIGEVPRPSLWRLEFRENLARHVVILRVDEKEEAQFYQLMKLEGGHERSSAALLFVHGYNVSFEDAVRRVAQLAYDLNFQGTPILYSWASQATLRGYPVDLANNEQTWGRLARFICQLRVYNESQIVHIICHSMGGRAVCHATTLLSMECPHADAGFRNIIFAAPDVHVSSFQATLPRLVAAAERVTLYFSPNDLALRVSRIFHETPRAGETALIADGLDTIDASQVPTGMLHHSVFGERTVLSDIFELIEHGTLPAHRFALEPIDGAEGRYYRIKE